MLTNRLLKSLTNCISFVEAKGFGKGIQFCFWVSAYQGEYEALREKAADPERRLWVYWVEARTRAEPIFIM